MQIGFSQRIQLEWLEQTAQLFIAGHPKQQIEEALQNILHDKLSVGGKAKRGNREKAISILMKTWVTVPKGLQPLRDDGLELLRSLPEGQHLPVHWGMSMAAYPFFGVVAGTVGRLFRLQARVSASQVQRRIREQLGERETVSRAARRVLRCFADWGVLKDTDQRGIYEAISTKPRLKQNITVWLVEVALVSNGSTALPLKSILQAPQYFPFKMSPVRSFDVESNSRMDVFRQALEEELVALKYTPHSMRLESRLRR